MPALFKHYPQSTGPRHPKGSGSGRDRRHRSPWGVLWIGKPRAFMSITRWFGGGAQAVQRDRLGPRVSGQGRAGSPGGSAIETVRQLALVGYRQPLETVRAPSREPLPGEILVKVNMAGVCGSDVHSWHGDVQRTLPIVLGHEGVGTVVSLGGGPIEDAAGDRVSVGDWVYWVPQRSCGSCYSCTVQQDASYCEKALPYCSPGTMNWNSYADAAILARGTTFFRVPEQTPDEAVVALGCALPTALSAFDRLELRGPPGTVVVQGSGPVGLAATLVASLRGASRVIVLDPFEERLELARELGATETIVLPAGAEGRSISHMVKARLGGRGADVVFEATGVLAAFEQGLAMVARNGRYLLVGLWAGDQATLINPFDILRNNIRIVGSAYAAPVHAYRALEIASRFPERLSRIVRRRFALEDALSAFRAVERGEPGKSVIVPAMAGGPG